MSVPSSLCVIGCGLIGGSVLRAAREAWPKMRLIAVEPDAAAREYIHQHQWADEVLATVPPDANGAEWVLLATPIPALEAVAASLSALTPGTVITDVASVKLPAIAAISSHVSVGVHFIPGHPIAGSEKSGITAADPSLFAGKRVVLTPEQPEAPALEAVTSFWRGLKAEVIFMPPDLHDRMYAAVSHLPQLLAFSVNSLCDNVNALGDARFTRLCHSDLTLWRGIFAANKTNIDRVLGLYLEALHQIIRELASEPQEPGDAAVAATLFPYFAASCLVSAVAREERVLGVKLRDFAGTGFADFTAPLTQNPETIMEKASANAPALAVLLGKFAEALEAN